MKKEEILNRLKAIKERESKATYGPWAWCALGEKENCYDIGVAIDKNNIPINGQFDDNQFDEEGILVDQVLTKDYIGSNEGAVVNYGDADFIAHARTDIPWMVEIIESLLQ